MIFTQTMEYSDIDDPDARPALPGMTFSRNLERLLFSRGMSQSDLARALDVSPAAVNQWVQGKTVPSGRRGREILKALNVTLAELESGDIGEPLTTPQEVPGTIDIPELPMSAVLPLDKTSGEQPIALDESRAQLGRWRVPVEVIRDHASSVPDLIVVRVQGNALAPDVVAGTYVIVDRAWRDVSPPGIYLIRDGLRLGLKRCERLLGARGGLVRVSTAQGWAEAEIPFGDLEQDILGRAIFKLMTPL